MSKFKKLVKRLFWRNTYEVPFEPMSKSFGIDRGTPIDRLYMNDFLTKHQKYIRGVCAEFGWPEFSIRFDSHINELHSFNCEEYPRNVNLDLMLRDALPHVEFYDCIICTNVLNFIPDVKSAVENMMLMLKPGGVALITVAGPSLISLYDYNRWGDYWRFTDQGLQFLFQKYNVTAVDTYGNFYASAHFLNGTVTEEVNIKKLQHKDGAYQILNCIAVEK